MRRTLHKKHFTKAERIFAEVLKRNKIPFETKVKISGYEADFLVKGWVVEIDGHRQNNEKNSVLLEAGYNLLHLSNKEVYELTFLDTIKKWLKK